MKIRIKDRVKKVSLIFRGKEPLTDGIRFRIFAVSLGCVHLSLAIIGALLMCLPLMTVNLIICLLDLLSIFRIRSGGNYFIWVSIIYFACCFQSLYACVLLGWSYGFSLYNLVMIPILFYFMYLTKPISNPKRYAVLYTWINCVATLVIRRLVYVGEPIYYFPIRTDFKVSFFNNIVCFLFLICFSTLFILELTVKHQELERQNQKLICLANYDELTSLRNRRSILTEWKKLQRTDYCVVMGDIDDFKKVNDTYGHEQGDEVLKLVAKSLSDAANAIDYVSRWGGEEFLMIIFGDISCALEVANKVQQRLKEAELKVGTQKLRITMTFGISECSGSWDVSIDELIRQADQRLYFGKESGKNCIISSDP